MRHRGEKDGMYEDMTQTAAKEDHYIKIGVQNKGIKLTFYDRIQRSGS